jgi:hypothetical protein
MNEIHRAKINRELKASERELIKTLLSHLPNPKPYIEQLDHLQVVGQCDCGCPTIDLALKEERQKSSEVPEILIEADGCSPEGISVGIILWTKAGDISQLEVYPWEDAAKFGLPDTRTLTNFGNRETDTKRLT